MESMQTQNISEDQWITFFDRFSHEHTGWPITIEVLDGQNGPQNVAEDLPLQGISFDTKGSRPCSVEISAGERPTLHISHVIDMPLRIRQTQEESGMIDIQIEPARGPITLLHVHSPVQ